MQLTMIQTVAMSTYTIMLSTVRRPPAQWIESLHESAVPQMSVSSISEWIKEPQTWQPGWWTHCTVILGSNPTLLELKDHEFVRMSAITVADTRGTMSLLEKEDGGAVEEEFARETLFRHPMISVRLFALPDDGARERYDQFLAALSTALRSRPGTEIHVAGKITNTEGEPLGSYDEALLLRYSGPDELSDSAWWEELSRAHELDGIFENSALAFVKEFVLPKKGVPIRVYDSSWSFGNPYEGYGDDFFG